MRRRETRLMHPGRGRSPRGPRAEVPRNEARPVFLNLWVGISFLGAA